MPSRRAICLFDSPSMTKRTISDSRGVRRTAGCAAGPALAAGARGIGAAASNAKSSLRIVFLLFVMTIAMLRSRAANVNRPIEEDLRRPIVRLDEANRPAAGL